MTWTYSGNPSASTRDEVRFLIGDTDTSDQQLSDEEIAYLLAGASSTAAAAVQAAEALASKFARLVDQTTGKISVSYSQRQAHYAALAARLRTSAVDPVPYLGGMSESDKDTDREDEDMVQPRFYRGMGDNPRARRDPDWECS